MAEAKVKSAGIFRRSLIFALDDEQYEKVNDALFGLIQAAFTAGWKAALGSDIGKVMKIDKR